MRTLLPSLLGLTTALAACDTPAPLASRSLPIVNGTAAPDDDAVVAIRFRSGELRCSGTLLTPHVVLTAAHCDLKATTYFDYQVFVGDDLAGAGESIDVTDVRVHPAYEPATLRSDLALLTLREAATATPATLIAGSLDGTPPGTTVRVVGYGRTAGGVEDEGVRRQGTSSLTELSAVELLLAPAPAQPCSFDSGGPAFMTLGGNEVLVGVTSRGDGGCTTYAKEIRVDAERAFIDAYLADAAPGQRALGERCSYDQHCSSGLCLAAPDDARLLYCSAPCASDDDCGELACVTPASGSPHCEYPTPTPGAVGSACAADADCLAAECVQEPDLPMVCAPACSPTAAECPAGFECTAIGGIRYACLPPPPAAEGCTCAVAPGRRPSLPLGAILALGALTALARPGSRRAATGRSRPPA